MSTDLATYLAFDGQCEAAFKFYEKVFRGQILIMMRHSDAPPEVPRSPETENRIMHARMKIGDRYLMGGDAPQQYFSKPQGFSVSFMVDDPSEAERVFGELSAGATVMMPMAETFWAKRFGMLIDRFGIPWMVNCEKQST
jgi:PhnB protein